MEKSELKNKSRSRFLLLLTAIDSRNWIRSNPPKDPLQNEAIFKMLHQVNRGG